MKICNGKHYCKWCKARSTGAFIAWEWKRTSEDGKVRTVAPTMCMECFTSDGPGKGHRSDTTTASAREVAEQWTALETRFAPPDVSTF